jgi:hypothetical protein
MKLATILAILAVLLLVVAPVAIEAKPAPKPKEVAVTGKITKVEEAAITVDAKNESKSIVLTADTKVLIQSGKDTKDGAKADLKVGEHVTVKCTEDSKAITITIKEAKGK